SIQMEERFENLMTKSKILEQLNRPTEVAAARKRAMEIASAQQLYFEGRQLQTAHKKDEAVAIYRMVAKRFPDHWLGHLAQARSHVADGDFPSAIKEVRASQTAAPAPQKPQLDN